MSTTEETVGQSSETRKASSRPGMIERLTYVLDAFVVGSDHLHLDDVAAATGIPRSTTFRILDQLVELRWLEHDARGYRLGPRANRVDGQRTDHSVIRSAASAELNSLHLSTGGVAHLTILSGSQVRYLDKIGGAIVDTIPTRVGGHFPAEATVSGRSLLACLPREQVDELLSSRIDSDRQLNLEGLHRKLERVRRLHGVAYLSATTCKVNISAVAAPILDPRGDAWGAVSMATRGPMNVGQSAPLVARAAERISQRMASGHRWGPVPSQGDQIG